MAGRYPARRYPRMLRVNEVVRETLAEELERLSDPRLELVTITSVDVSPDLRNATVYYAALGRHDDDTLAALTSAAAHLRRVLGRQVRLKYLPALEFREDPAIEQGARIDAILRDLQLGQGNDGSR